MKVLLILKSTPQMEAPGATPDPKDAATMGAFIQEMVKAGVLLDAAGLKPSSHGARVSYAGKQRTVTDGPFAEAKELVAGYWLLQVKDLAEAVEWAKRLPIGLGVMNGEEPVVEVRPMWEFEPPKP